MGRPASELDPILGQIPPSVVERLPPWLGWVLIRLEVVAGCEVDELVPFEDTPHAVRAVKGVEQTRQVEHGREREVVQWESDQWAAELRDVAVQRREDRHARGEEGDVDDCRMDGKKGRGSAG